METNPSACNTHLLLARCRTGDPAALNSLIERYLERVARLVRVRLGPALAARESVDDVVQGVLLRLVQSVARYEERTDAGFICYVASQVENEIRNLARRDRTQKRGGHLPRASAPPEASSILGAIPANSSDACAKASRAEQARVLDACLAELSEAHREVILLRDFAGHDWKTVAELMGRSSPEACQELRRRALRELDERMGGRLG
ncbi:MAG: sigma-70 family RNA polymerase sigma factor [Planctomycetota bacterium]